MSPVVLCSACKIFVQLIKSLFAQFTGQSPLGVTTQLPPPLCSRSPIRCSLFAAVGEAEIKHDGNFPAATVTLLCFINYPQKSPPHFKRTSQSE